VNQLNTSLYWRSKGISTIPLYHRSKTPHSQKLIQSGLTKSNGQATWLPLKNRLPTEQEINTWLVSNGKSNLAIVTTDRLVVLDFDNPQAYADWFCWQLEYRPVVTKTHVVATARGLHLYYWLKQPLAKPIKSNEPYEIKSHGRLITVPPSLHPTGKSYRALNHPDSVLTIDSIEDVLTFSPVVLKGSVMAYDPWRVNDKRQSITTDYEREDLLEMFPEAKQTDEHYWLADCPLHGHKANFWLDTKNNIAGCFGGCLSTTGKDYFLASELIEIMEREK